MLPEENPPVDVPPEELLPLPAGLEYTVVEDERMPLPDDLTAEPVDAPSDDVPLALELLTEDLDEDDLTDDSGLLTEEIDDLELPVRPVKADDLVDVAAADVLVAEAAPLDLVMEELLTPADLEEEPMPLLAPEPVVVSRGV